MPKTALQLVEDTLTITVTQVLILYSCVSRLIPECAVSHIMSTLGIHMSCIVLGTLRTTYIHATFNMYLVINKCVTAVKVSNFTAHYLRNRSTLDIGVLGPGTPCVYPQPGGRLI